MNDGSAGNDLELMVGGKPVARAAEFVRRHCGLPDSRGRVEHWGYAVFDAVPSTDGDTITAGDLGAVAALGVRLSQATLDTVLRSAPEVAAMIARLPRDLSLEHASDADLRLVDTTVSSLTADDGPLQGVPITTVAKLVHRKRPRLVPPYDRSIGDWYGSALGDSRRGKWPGVMELLRDDLNLGRAVLSTWQTDLALEMDGAVVPSRLRLLDIAVWMANRHQAFVGNPT